MLPHNCVYSAILHQMNVFFEMDFAFNSVLAHKEEFLSQYA